MRSDEVIIVSDLDREKALKIVENALRYALISCPFTYDRMAKNDLALRIKNIAKGKIAEGIFKNYCLENHISVDFNACETPFWMYDQRDFLYLGGEWDLKNNFITCSDKLFKDLDFGRLPALIPNKYEQDQWSKRDHTFFETSKFGAYVFSYMRLKRENPDFFFLHLKDEVFAFIADISQRYYHYRYKSMPFEQARFWGELDILLNKDWFGLYYIPELIITSCANSRYWKYFLDTSYQNFNYQILENKPWYIEKNQILKFQDNILVTKINNRTCPNSLLPSFGSVVKNNI